MKKALAEITGFNIHKPRICLAQRDSLNWMASVHAQAEFEAQGLERLELSVLKAELEKLVFKYGVGPSKVSQRYFDVTDVHSQNWNDAEIYQFGGPSNPGVSPNGQDIGVRAEFFLRRSCEIFRSFYPTVDNPPGHLIHVTCTGYASPSAAQRQIVKNGWNCKTNVTHAYHMGCYAALSAIRLGEGLVAANQYQVDVVHTEICSLHMNPLDHSPEQIVVQSLFADGHIKYSVVPAGTAQSGFVILNVAEQLIDDSAEDMTWTAASWGMKMTLSRKVPLKIAAQIKPFIERLIAPTGRSLGTILNEALFALHPGGPSIVQAVQNTLELKNEQVAESRKILSERGNISSATLPHIWQSIIASAPDSGRIVVSLAFGPGLTLFGAVFVII